MKEDPYTIKESAKDITKEKESSKEKESTKDKDSSKTVSDEDITN